MPVKDQPQAKFVPITDPNNCPVDFVNFVAASGILNGVVNLTFAQARHMPKVTGDLDPDFIVASRLRMDLQCAMQLREQLDRIIAEAQSQVRQALATTAGAGPSGKSS